MIEYADITNFTTWFIQQVKNIWTTSFTYLDSIHIWGNVSLIKFIITLVLITALIPVLINGSKNIKIKGERKKHDNK